MQLRYMTINSFVGGSWFVVGRGWLSQGKWSAKLNWSAGMAGLLQGHGENCLYNALRCNCSIVVDEL